MVKELTHTSKMANVFSINKVNVLITNLSKKVEELLLRLSLNL